MNDKEVKENVTRSQEGKGEIRERKSTNINSELSTKEAYFASLAEWAKQAALVQMFPNYLLSNYTFPLQTQLPFATTSSEQPQTDGLAQQPAVTQVNSNTPAVRPNFNRFRVLDDVQQQEIIQRFGGTEMIVAPFWKRAIAEAIDMFIIFILKIIITFSIFHIFDIEFEKDVMRKTLDDDLFVGFFDASMDFISLSSDLLLIESLTKLIVCSYECLWTVFNNGATPGKSLMKIRVLYVEAVLPLQAPPMPQFILQAQREPLRAIIYPAETPSLIRSMMRSLAKNLLMTLLFPICVVMVFFKNNRTAYDIITKTIVVDTNPNRVVPTGAAPVPPQRPHQQ